MINTRVFTDPNTFTENDLPIIVLSDDRRGFFGWAIREHTSGNWNHSFIMHRPGIIATQGFHLFKKLPIDAYLKSSQMLKFWRIKNLSILEKTVIITAIEKRLALPWWRRGYDWVGIIGQALRLNFIQNPLQTFCSEQARIDYVSRIPRADKFVIRQPSPSAIDFLFKLHPEIFECLGYWWDD